MLCQLHNRPTFYAAAPLTVDAGTTGVLAATAADRSAAFAVMVATTASTSDVGAAAGVVTLAALLGVACGAPVSATVSVVMLTRGTFMGRI